MKFQIPTEPTMFCLAPYDPATDNTLLPECRTCSYDADDCPGFYAREIGGDCERWKEKTK